MKRKPFARLFARRRWRSGDRGAYRRCETPARHDQKLPCVAGRMRQREDRTCSLPPAPVADGYNIAALQARQFARPRRPDIGAIALAAEDRRQQRGRLALECAGKRRAPGLARRQDGNADRPGHDETERQPHHGGRLTVVPGRNDEAPPPPAPGVEKRRTQTAVASALAHDFVAHCSPQPESRPKPADLALAKDLAVDRCGGKRCPRRHRVSAGGRGGDVNCPDRQDGCGCVSAGRRGPAMIPARARQGRFRLINRSEIQLKVEYGDSDSLNSRFSPSLVRRHLALGASQLR